MVSISALIIARNEEKKIENTLKSIAFVDEIIIVLDRTTDNTEKICKKFTKKIYKGKWISEGRRRNFGIDKCNSTWILEIDADEVVSNDLSKEIKQVIRDNAYDFFYLSLVNYIGLTPVKFGWMACLAPDGKFSLFKKKNKSWLDGRVHPDYKLNGCKGPQLKNYIQHNMSDNISDLLVRFNRNTSFASKDLVEKKTTLKKYFSFRKILSRFCFGSGLPASSVNSLFNFLSPFLFCAGKFLNVSNDAALGLKRIV